ncbi:hypothetical protein WN51_12846, partial [Melipona quadrifasciata]
RVNCGNTFSISSIQAAKSMPKSINSQSMPSFLYSSCSSTNMLKNCCSFSLVKLIHSCSKPLYWRNEMKRTIFGNEQRDLKINMRTIVVRTK